ncbi:molybdenum cofactor biosynthesis protein MoaE [Stappia taiwanensis]|uniref:Molybdopterin synthase catalytic subunit n=1 Tax=Stappia taiwanensis TaxID=992267 RepID=A0A838XR87_9HYPH|nr:molybdenum cofactor biosynthesis protein MoaE [Stappia taiwanensis]MBA4611198.1 molybdenum cofactor biosynthesis protein MoaE [Stappia taiwanensis]GGE86724.1 molybdenum cofactor biosynthesis protein MoaE [Stappia taiwanensis]
MSPHSPSPIGSDETRTNSAGITVRIQAEDFDAGREIAALTEGNGNAGAVVTFTGLCRDEDGRLAALELEHYPGMAEAEITRIAEEACRRWPLGGLTVIHRHGRIVPGANIVLVVAVSRHRRAAFEAAEFLMDYLKTRAPFWKKEHLRDGGDGGWVDARDSDTRDADRWTAARPVDP